MAKVLNLVIVDKPIRISKYNVRTVVFTGQSAMVWTIETAKQAASQLKKSKSQPYDTSLDQPANK
jgi:hypothetical protein